MKLKFELPDGSYSVSDTQDYFEHIFKKNGEKTDNPSIKKMQINQKIELCLKKTGYHLKLLTPETIKLLGCNKNKITFIPNKSFGQLLPTSPKKNIFLQSDFQKNLFCLLQ